MELLSAAVGAGIAVFGVVVGKLMDMRAETKRRALDHKRVDDEELRRAYTECLASVLHYHTLSSLQSVPGLSTDAQYVEASRSLDTSIASVALFGHPDILELLGGWRGYVGRCRRPDATDQDRALMHEALIEIAHRMSRQIKGLPMPGPVPEKLLASLPAKDAPSAERKPARAAQGVS